LVKRTPPPAQEQFPGPSPLTPEERALLVFVAHNAEAARELAREPREIAPSPIVIDSISVEPLKNGG
jgi:hypothetical protein